MSMRVCLFACVYVCIHILYCVIRLFITRQLPRCCFMFMHDAGHFTSTCVMIIRKTHLR